MSVRKINNWWWVDFRHGHERYRKKSPANTRGAALTYEAVLRQRVAHGEPAVPPSQPKAVTFTEFSDHWYRTDVLPNNKPSEQRAKLGILKNHLLPFFGKQPVEAIGTAQIERFKAGRSQRGFAPKTVNNHLAALGRALTCAEDWGAIERRPKIRFMKLPVQSFDFLPETDSTRLLTAAPDGPGRTALLLALRTGLRFGELLGLHWSDLDLATRTITVRRSIVRRQVGTPKSNRFRTLPIADDLLAHLQASSRRTGYVLGQDGEQPPTEKSLRRALSLSCKRAGLRHIGWHTLRHSFASQLVKSGAHLRVVQELLGHTDIRVTMRYTHLEPSRLVEAVNRLAAPVPSLPSTWAPHHTIPLAGTSRHEFGQPVGTEPATAAQERQKAQECWTLIGRGAGNRTPATATPWPRTTSIRHPADSGY